jgi:sugar O-acyltransferase (sialic acid O-acetyltransferase NeuD family)
MKDEEIAIYGASGFGREVAWLAETCATEGTAVRVACFIDDNTVKHGLSLNDIPILGLEEARKKFPDALIVAGVGVPAVRVRMMKKAAAAGFSFKTLIHPRVEMSRWIEIGEGSVICTGNILTTNIIIGKHVQINLDCTVGHDVVMGDYATLAPGVHVSGCVHIGKQVYIGTGATIINGTQDDPLVIGDKAIVGAGACVTKSIPSGQTWGGVPAKLLKSGPLDTFPGGTTT